MGTENKWRYTNLNPDTPSLRGLVKVHKKDTPIRPIVNYRNAPSYKLAKMFTEKLKTYIPLPHVYNVQNSVQLMKDLSEIPFNPRLKLASLDISNMYTNIPTEELLKIIDTMCEKHNLEDTLRHEILEIARLIIAQNYFKFQEKTYLQKNGLAMGAPTSSILSEIYLQFTENTKIYDILRHSKVQGYFRYVDDILLVYEDNLTNIEEVLNLFNNITPGLTFTLEREQDGKLNFLDLTISKDKNELSFGIFRKPTTTDTIIPNDSCHPLEQKMAAIRYFATRIHSYDLNHVQKQKEIDTVNKSS